MARNPFAQTGTIRDPQFFYGRKREVRQLFDFALKLQPCAIIGDGKIGKSSLLEYIRHPATRQAEGCDLDKDMFCLFDFQQHPQITKPKFWQLILEEISSQVTDVQVQQVITSVVDEGSFANDRIDRLMRAFRRQEIRLFILLDEFECIKESPELFEPSFLAMLRSLSNRFDLVYILASESELYQLIPDSFGSPFPNVFAQIYLGMLESDETHDLIGQAKHPLDLSLQSDESFIMHVTGGHPYLTQVLCYRLFDLKAQKPEIVARDYETVLAESLKDATPFFEKNLWPTFTDVEQQLLINVAWGQEVDSHTYRIEVDRLENRRQYLNRQNGQLRIFSEMFQKFIREHSQGPHKAAIPSPPRGKEIMPQYDDLEILVESRRAGEGYPVRIIRSSAGEVKGQSPFDPLSATTTIVDIQNSNTDRQFLKTVGDTLFNAIMVGDVRRYYDKSKPSTGETDQNLRIRLRIDPPELASLPWEFLYDRAEDRWLAMSSSIALSRYVESPRPIEKLEIKLPLNILAVLSCPPDVSKHQLSILDLEKEYQEIQGALEPLIEANLVTLDPLRNATTQSIRERIYRGDIQYHVLHFSGHGFFVDDDNRTNFPDLETDTGYLLIQDSEGQCRPIDEETMAQLLSETSVRLAIFNACQTGASSATRQLAGLANRVIQLGPPAVVAMQYKITDSVAHLLMREFYSYLCSGYPIDYCLTQARKAIAIDFGYEQRHWAAPVLFMRAPNGMLFDIQAAD
jgi:hypothetical protein